MKDRACIKFEAYLPDYNDESNKVIKITNAASEKTEEIEAVLKISSFLKEEKIANLNFHPDYIHLDNPKAKSQILQLCKKSNIADLLYSEQRNDFSHIVVYDNSHPNTTWTAKIPEKFHGASLKEERKLKGNIFYPN